MIESMLNDVHFTNSFNVSNNNDRNNKVDEVIKKISSYLKAQGISMNGEKIEKLANILKDGNIDAFRKWVKENVGQDKQLNLEQFAQIFKILGDSQIISNEKQESINKKDIAVLSNLLAQTIAYNTVQDMWKVYEQYVQDYSRQEKEDTKAADKKRDEKKAIEKEISKKIEQLLLEIGPYLSPILKASMDQLQKAIGDPQTMMIDKLSQLKSLQKQLASV